MTEIPYFQPEAAPRPFNAVKAFADSVLAMLDERIKTADRGTHPFNDYFGDKPEAIVTAKAQASELREVRTQVRMLGDRALVDLMKFKPAVPAPEGGDAPLVVKTAPARIWLQVSDDAEHNDKPFPASTHGDEVTWCQDNVLACEVEYIRSDLAAQPLAGPADDHDDALTVAYMAGAHDARKAARQAPAEEIANAARVIAWARDPERKPAQAAFTAGPERQAAYWIEWAQSEIVPQTKERP